MPDWVTDTRALLAIAIVLVGVGIWVGRVNSDRSAFKEFMKEVRTDIKKILGYVGPRLSTTDSPVILNELGKKVSDAMGIKGWAKKAAPTLLEKVAGWKEHQIYDFCLKHAEELDLTDDQKDTAKALAYEHNFRPEEVRTAFAIELRDALLALQGEASGEQLPQRKGGRE